MDELIQTKKDQEMKDVYTIPKINPKSKKLLKNKENMSFIKRSAF